MKAVFCVLVLLIIVEIYMCVLMEEGNAYIKKLIEYFERKCE